jgi:hypothetical protein
LEWKERVFCILVSAFPIIEERIIALPNNTNGVLLHLNYPKSLPNNVEYTQHLVAPLGDVIIVELSGVSFTENGCPYGGSITVSLLTLGYVSDSLIH